MDRSRCLQWRGFVILCCGGAFAEAKDIEPASLTMSILSPSKSLQAIPMHRDSPGFVGARGRRILNFSVPVAHNPAKAEGDKL